MAVMKNQDKRENSDSKALEASGKNKLVKKEGAQKKIVAKAEAKKTVPVKKEKTNRLEHAKKFFRGVLKELKKVHWPNRREITIYTGVVLFAVVLVAVLLWFFDSILSRLMSLIVS